MIRVFADTCYYVALCSPRDRWHDAAFEASKQCRAHVVTTEYILLEVGNYFRDTADRSLFLSLYEHLRESEHTVIVPISADILQAAISLYGDRMDKDWSLTDCTSFVVMREWKIEKALSCDHHFEQAGFHLLMET